MKRLKPIEWVDETSWMQNKVPWISELEIISSVFYFTGFKYLIIRKGCIYLTLWKYTWCHFKFGKLCCSQLSRVRPEQLAVKLPKDQVPNLRSVTAKKSNNPLTVATKVLNKKSERKIILLSMKAVSRGCICKATAAAALWYHQVSQEYQQCRKLRFTKDDRIICCFVWSTISTVNNNIKWIYCNSHRYCKTKWMKIIWMYLLLNFMIQTILTSTGWRPVESVNNIKKTSKKASKFYQEIVVRKWQAS